MIALGIDRLFNERFDLIRGRRVGLYTNLNAVNADLVPSYVLFALAKNTNLAALFGPEHGINGAASAGEGISSRIDDYSRVPVYSLYGETNKPLAQMLRDLDVIVCDIQDVGARFYTYIWTLSYILDACAEEGVPVIVCDRPNPLGGQIVQGPGVQPGFESFVGRFDVPIRHGLTIGEMAQLLNAEYLAKPADLTVIPCGGWQRAMLFPQTGLRWVAPSPGLPHFANLENYPGACLVEGTTLSEGRGTGFAFQVVGAPFVSAAALAERLNALDMPGVRFRPIVFRPCASKHAGADCAGAMAHVTDPAAYNPITTWLAVLREVMITYPGQADWLPPRGGRHHFDLLIGNGWVRQALLDEAANVRALADQWASAEADFRARRAPYLLYDE
jgi:uncharacterized protein YbbC (DUF1343 family)